MPTNAELLKQSKKYKLVEMDSDEENGWDPTKLSKDKKSDKKK